MKKHWRYLKSVVRHKWFVFWACLRMGVPVWWAVIHDWDKFMPWMWGPYADYFYGDQQRRDKDGNYASPGARDRNNSPRAGESLAFDIAWNGHQKLNKHHWQYWVINKDDGSVYPLPMPDRHRREMLADWIGAGKAYVKDWSSIEPVKWYEKNKNKMQLHSDTRAWVETQMAERHRQFELEEHHRHLGLISFQSKW